MAHDAEPACDDESIDANNSIQVRDPAGGSPHAAAMFAWRRFSALARFLPSLGIRLRLIVAFGAIATLTLVAAAVSIYFFGQVEQRFVYLANNGIPAVRSLSQLAIDSNQVNLRASELAKAASQSERSLANKDLYQAVDILAGRMKKLAADKTFSIDIDDVSEIVGSYEAHLKEIDDATRNRLASRDLKTKKLTELFEIHENMTKRIAPIVDDAFFNVAIGGEDSSKKSNEIVNKLVNHDVLVLRQLLEARSETNLISGLLIAAELTHDSGLLALFQDKTIAALKRLDNALTPLKTEAKIAPVPDKFAAMRAFATGPKSVFVKNTQIIDDFGTTNKSGSLSEIVRLQQTIDNALIQNLDERGFDLTIEAEEAVKNNNEIIVGLVQNQVTTLKTALEAAGALHQLVAALVRGALTDEDSMLEPLQSNLDRIKKSLVQSIKIINSKELSKSYTALAIFADAKTGLLADRRAEFRAIQQATWLVAQMSETSDELSALIQTLLRKQQQVTSVQAAEVREMIGDGRAFLIADVLASLAVAAFIGLFVVHRGLARPMGSLTAAMRKLAEGDTNIPLEGTERHDEIGEMINAVSVFRDNAIERQKLQSAQKKEQEERVKRQQRVDELISAFRADASELLQSVGMNMEQMRDTADTLTDVANDTADQAEGASAATAEASSNVETVAAAAEELASSISEIGQQVGQAAQIVSEAADHVHSTNDKVASLSAAANKIGDVVNLIQEIAEQTNLLALNATIEAARAGESGRGFAVVASEVKSLAGQTARATDEIAAHISHIQSETNDAVQAITAINTNMDKVNSYTAAIAAAVEEQGTATQQISANVQNAADGARDVAKNVNGLRSAVAETTQSAAHVRQASCDAVEQTKDLSEVVDEFLKHVATA